MSFHDRVTRAAVNNGNTSGQFHKAAQLHANGTWLAFIAGAVVWSFAGWKWALVPAAFAAYGVIKSIGATRIAMTLEKLEQASSGLPTS